MSTFDGYLTDADGNVLYPVTRWEDILNKPEELPETVKDRYLHTNAETGKYEWSEISVSGGGTWSSITGKPFDTLGETLKVNGRALDVNSAGEVEKDNSLPITSGAVYTMVGNIQALLETI